MSYYKIFVGRLKFIVGNLFRPMFFLSATFPDSEVASVTKPGTVTNSCFGYPHKSPMSRRRILNNVTVPPKTNISKFPAYRVSKVLCYHEHFVSIVSAFYGPSELRPPKKIVAARHIYNCFNGWIFIVPWNQPRRRGYWKLSWRFHWSV